MNNFSNFIPNKFANLDENILSWMSEYNKLNNKFKWNNKIYEEYLNKDNKNVDYITLQNPITEVLPLIGKSKDDYNNQLRKKKKITPKTISRTYWCILQ